jgi:molybdopterin molybdotransferase
VQCSLRPRVAIVTTGDELVEVGASLAPGQVRNSNLYALRALTEHAGAEVASAVTIPDDRERTVQALRAGLAANVLIAAGGVSVGEHDHVKGALAALEVEQVFWGVALRPGHPTWFGERRREAGEPGQTSTCLVFGLPGNPVSAMVTFLLFVAPALSALCGARDEHRDATAVMDADYPKRPGRAHAVRCLLEARDDGWHVRPTKAQGSHVLTSMVGARALALLEAERGDVAAGERVRIRLI